MARRSEKRRLSARPVGVRLTPATAERVAGAAALEDLSVAAWLRARAVEAAGAPPEDARPTPRIEAPFVPSPALATVGHLAATVSRLNGAVVQLTRTGRETGAADLHGDAEVVLAALREARADLGKFVDALRAAEEAKC